MIAAVLHKHQSPLEVAKVPKVGGVQLGRNEVLIQIKACGVCHTDLHICDGDWRSNCQCIFPLTPGHEGAGIVVEIGAGSDTGVKMGDKVGLPFLYSSCQTCEFCLSGWETLCLHQKNTGVNKNGCLADFVVASAQNCIPIPDNLSFVQAAPIMCAGVTSYKGLKETEARPGQFVTIVGAAGGLGHLAIQYARAMGLRVVALDVGKDKLDYCMQLGAEVAYDASAESTIQQVEIFTRGGSHAVLCVAPHTAAFKTAIAICRRKGTVVLVGLPPSNFDCDIFNVVMKRITIRGSIVGTRNDLREALDFAARGLVKCEVETANLSSINDVFDRLRKGQVQGRVVIEMGPGGQCEAPSAKRA